MRPDGPLMEARGFEPRSEIRSTTAPTCVARRLGSPETGQRAAHPRTSLQEFRPAREGATPDYPDIAILMKPPRAGFLMSKAHNAYVLRGQGQVSVGSCGFPRGLARTKDLGTPPQLHRPRRSQVAPDVEENLVEGARRFNALSLAKHMNASGV